ncbi:MAG: hypothetical protein FD138_1415 [Planctomycetota bacterium]|nr:MAG: hypothetical protein FD138_1415 [Planctomycetota bacterium]
MSKAPAFQFYAADFLVGTAAMTNEEVGIYIRLLCHQWDRGLVPKDKAARIVGVKKIPADVLAKFVDTDGELRNERLEAVRKEQQNYHEKKSLSGKAGAAARWDRSRDVIRHADTNGEPMALPSACQSQNDNPSPPTSSSSSNSNPNTTTIPDEWLVVVNELKIFGCWDDTIPPTVATARQKGLTPQTVSDLIRFAASKVIALDTDGRPVSQWEMPSGDDLEAASLPHGRVYRWGPPMLLRRIANQELHSGIADGWPGKSDKTAPYDEAFHKLAAVPKVPRDDSEEAASRQAQADVLRIEREKLEDCYGTTIDDLPLAEAIALLPSVLKSVYSRSQKDPRKDRRDRFQVLRAFAAGVASECTLTTTDETASETDTTSNRAPNAQPPPTVSPVPKRERTPHGNEASALRSAQSP